MGLFEMTTQFRHSLSVSLFSLNINKTVYRHRQLLSHLLKLLNPLGSTKDTKLGIFFS